MPESNPHRAGGRETGEVSEAGDASESHPEPQPSAELDPVERGFVNFFVQMAQALGLPRSVGEIFGFLFAASGPQPFDRVVERLGISKGSASQGLRFLVKTGAVGTVYVPRDRRTFYEAESSMRKVFGGALRETVRPHLEGNRRLVEDLEALLEPGAGLDPAKAAHYRGRIASLEGWNAKALLVLPLLDKLFSLPAPLLPLSLLKADPDPAD